MLGGGGREGGQPARPYDRPYFCSGKLRFVAAGSHPCSEQQEPGAAARRGPGCLRLGGFGESGALASLVQPPFVHLHPDLHL